MKTEILIDAIGQIDARYVEEAELWTPKVDRSERKVSGFWSLSRKRALATAACFALIVTGLLVALRNPGREDMADGAHMGANNLKGSEESQEAGGDSGGMENGAADQTDGAGQENKAGQADGAGQENKAGQAEQSGGAGRADGAEQSGGAGQSDGAGQPDADAPTYAATQGGPDRVKDYLLEALGDTESIAVTRYSGGREKAYTLEGADVKALKEWMKTLTLGEEAIFEEGAYPGEVSEGGEVYYFETLEGGAVFSYRDFGDCYLVLKDHWYPVLNPAQPPLPD